MDQLPLQVNMITLKDIALLPGGLVSFKVGREKSIRALENALKSGKQLALFPQIDAEVEVPEVNDLLPIGTLSEILSHEELNSNLIRVIARGIKRIQVSKLIKSSPYFIIKPGEVVETDSEANIILPPKKDIQEAASLLLKHKPDLPLGSSSSPVPYDSEPGRLADILVQRSGTNYDNQLACLLELNPRKRLRFAYGILVKEGQQAQLESEINEQVTMAIRDEHREIFLRGQLRVILEELGENAPLSLYNPIFRGKSFKANPNLLFV